MSPIVPRQIIFWARATVVWLILCTACRPTEGVPTPPTKSAGGIPAEETVVKMQTETLTSSKGSAAATLPDGAVELMATPISNFPVMAVHTPEDVAQYFAQWPDEHKMRLADDAEYTHYESEDGQACLEEILADEELLKELQAHVIGRWEREIKPLPATSPDGQWHVTTHTSDLVPPEEGETEQFPNGKYHVEMIVERTNGSQAWTAVDEWRGRGLGLTYPEPVRWSADGRFLYFANVPVPDGCSVLVNGGDLWRLDLDSGAVTESTPYIGLVMALSPDETQLAVNASYGRGFFLRDLATGAEQSIPLPQPGDWWQMSGLQWSPNGQHLLLTQAVNPCSPEMETAIVRIDINDLLATTILKPDGRNFTLLEWVRDDKVRLLDEAGHVWFQDVFSAELALTETAVSPNLSLLYLQNGLLSRLQLDDMTTQPVTLDTQGDISAALLSSDGRYLAYSDRTGLHRLDMDSGTTKGWLSGSTEPWEQFWPRAWSATNTLLVQRTWGTENTAPGWAEIGDDSWHPLPLPDGLTAEFYGLDSGAAWSPGGTQLALAGYDYAIPSNVPGLTVINLETGTAQRIVTRMIASGIEGGDPLMAGVYDPAWSPDGDWIAFGLEEDAAESLNFPVRLYLVRPDGADLTPLTNNPQGSATHPVWTADGNLYYSLTNVSDAVDGIYHYDLTAQTHTLLIPGSNLAPMSLSADEKFLACRQTRSEDRFLFLDLKVWSVDTGQTIPVAEGRDGDPVKFVGWQSAD